mgnify:CR=1 FL=1|jgi:hypothetical protein
MPTLCPGCGNPFADDAVNVAADVAYCRVCDKAHALSSLVKKQGPDPEEDLGQVDLLSPPVGAWYRDDGVEVVIGATARHASIAWFFVLFSGFWNLVTWTILLAMIFGSSNVSGPGITHSGGQTHVDLIAYLFMIPFIAVGLGTGAAALILLFGRCEVRIRGVDGVLFRGIGFLSRRTPFDPSTVTAVRTRPSGWLQNNRPMSEIVLEGPGLRFGASLTPERRKFLAAALRKVLGC